MPSAFAGSGHSFCRGVQRLYRRTRANQAAIAIHIVDLVYRGPILIDLKAADRKARLFARIDVVPVIGEIMSRMRCILEGLSSRGNSPASIA